MCASCQCYILSNHNLPLMQDEEEAMLSEVFNTKEYSRLSCQIPITENLNNLKIEIADEIRASIQAGDWPKNKTESSRAVLSVINDYINFVRR